MWLSSFIFCSVPNSVTNFSVDSVTSTLFSTSEFPESEEIDVEEDEIPEGQ